MKRIAYILTSLFLLASCSNEEHVQAPQSDWTPNISRTATGGQELRIVGKKDGTTQFDAILIPATDGGKATWKYNIKPNADKVNASNEFIAFAPAGENLPVSLVHGDTDLYMVDYHTTKPNSFNMQPMLSQLKVHIWVEETTVHNPTNDSIYLYTKADIDYPNVPNKKFFKNWTLRDHVCLDSISQSGTQEQDGYHFDKFSMVEPLVVLPQTIPAGEEVLWFSIEDAHYYYKPEEPIELKPGYLTNLTLHVVFIEEESGDPIDPPTKKVISIDHSTVTITPWEVGETIEEDIYNPNNN